MSNTFLTTKTIAREALPILKENLVFPQLIHTDYSKEFSKQGDTIRVRKPAVFEAKDFKEQIDMQDFNESDVEITLDNISDVSIELTAKEMALNVEDFSKQILEPACVAIAEKVNAKGLELYKDIPYITGIAGNTPDGLDDFANARKVLNINKAPLQYRRAVWNPDADAKFGVIDAVVNAEKSGTTQALREGSIGRIQGFDNYMAQSVASHTTGVTTWTTVKCGAAASEGDTTISLSGTALTGKLVKGDLITIANKTYTVTEDTAVASSNAIASVKIYPGLATAVTTSTTVTAVSSHIANLAFHKNAFAFVSAPLSAAMGADSYSLSYEGLNLRVTMDYSINTKKTTMSIDTLYGYKTIYPELACRVLG